MRKFDEITAKIMEYMDVHTKRSPEEMEKEQGQKGRKGGDPNKRPRLDLI